MRIKSKVIIGIITTSVLLLLITTASAVVFSGLENEEIIWTDTGTAAAKSIDSIEDIFGWGIKILLILVLAIGIIIFYRKENKGMAVGYAIAEFSAVIAVMFSIVGIEILSETFLVSAVVVLIILIGIALSTKTSLSQKTR